MITAADGTILCSSGTYRGAVYINGSYYNTDRGIDPHIYLTKTESYYDREHLTEYINSLK
jgi:hypothetical protein